MNNKTKEKIVWLSDYLYEKKSNTHIRSAFGPYLANWTMISRPSTTLPKNKPNRTYKNNKPYNLISIQEKTK